MPPKRPSTRGGKAAASTNPGATQNTAVEPTNTVAEDVQDGPSTSTVEMPGPASVASTRPLEQPAQSPSAPPSRGRGSSGRPVARPRGIGRRSHKDRAELEKAEQERRQAEAAAKARETAWKQRRDLARNRGSARGRMRGGYAGDLERRKDNPSAAVSGPFSLGEVSKHKNARAAYSGSGIVRGTGGGSGGGGGGGNSIGGVGGTGSAGRSLKQEHSAAQTDIHIKQEDGGYISSDDETGGPRKLNIDNLIDLTGEEEEESAYLPPVRIQRVEHKERTLVSTTEASGGADSNIPDDGAHATEHKRGKQKAKDVEITGESHRYRGTYTDSSSEDEGQIKAEPTDNDNRPVAPDAMQSPPTSPEARRKAKERIKGGVPGQKSHKPAFQTKEEELEWDIHERDLRILRTELGQMALPPAAMDSNPPSTDATHADEDPRADKVYLFQLPAVLPTLVPVVPKAEDEDVNMQDVPEVGAATQQDSKATKQSILRGGNAPPAGLVGKLRVHASGRAYLDWGGIPMEVSMGQEANFLQDVVVLDSRDPKANAADADDDIAGMAMSMGQVKGKFVVVPEWDKIFEEVA